MVQYFREFRDRSHDHENFIHEIFAYTYTRIPAARNHEIYFHENLLLSRFREIHENLELYGIYWLVNYVQVVEMDKPGYGVN